jgi:hypothetical protein
LGVAGIEGAPLGTGMLFRPETPRLRARQGSFNLARTALDKIAAPQKKRMNQRTKRSVQTSYRYILIKFV